MKVLIIENEQRTEIAVSGQEQGEDVILDHLNRFNAQGITLRGTGSRPKGAIVSFTSARGGQYRTNAQVFLGLMR